MAEATLRGLGSRRRSRRLFVAGMILVGGLGLVAAAAPWLTSYDPDAIVVPHYTGPLPPGSAHPPRTDTLGRDVWAALAYRAQASSFSRRSACRARSASTRASPTSAWACRCRRRRGAAW